MNNLHLYAQQQWHDEAFIVGDEAGLRELITALQRALDQRSNQTTDDLFTSDGEGYNVHICLVGSEEFQKFAVPYTDDMAKDQSDSAIWPWTRVHSQKG